MTGSFHAALVRASTGDPAGITARRNQTSIKADKWLDRAGSNAANGIQCHLVQFVVVAIHQPHGHLFRLAVDVDKTKELQSRQPI